MLSAACFAQFERTTGRLPLHWAIERLLPLPILLCIDDANPLDAAFVADSKGTLSENNLCGYHNVTVCTYDLYALNTVVQVGALSTTLCTTRRQLHWYSAYCEQTLHWLR